jgi:hypothetical protein
LPLEIEFYRGYLDGMNLSEAAEMLRALWSILSAFVDLGFGVDSVHLARPQVRDEAASETDNAAENALPAQQLRWRALGDDFRTFVLR